MTWADVQVLRKSGRFQEAVDLGLQELANDPDDFKLRTQIDWAFYGLVKTHVSGIVSTLKGGQPAPNAVVNQIHQALRRYTPSPPGGGNGNGPGGGNGDGDGDGDGESGFGGSCMQGFGCEGDAIFCAIAKEQHRRACKLFDDKSAESDLYDKEKGKEGEQTKDLPGNKEESMANRISTANAFGGGQCIRDLNIVVVGNSVTLPMSKICPSLEIIGNIMVAVSLLLAIRIVGRG